MSIIVTSTIVVPIVPLIVETDGDVTERRDLRLGTPRRPTHVYQARLMNVRCQILKLHTKKLHEATANRTVGSASASLGHSNLRFGTMQFVLGRLSSGIQLACAGFCQQSEH